MLIHLDDDDAKEAFKLFLNRLFKSDFNVTNVKKPQGRQHSYAIEFKRAEPPPNETTAQPLVAEDETAHIRAMQARLEKAKTENLRRD